MKQPLISPLMYFISDDSRKALSRPALLPEKSIWNKKLKKYSGVIATKFLRAPGK
jgi:hypothetical protein